MTAELSKLQSKSKTQDREWLKLLSQIAEGDESALSKLYDGTSGLVYGLALRILSDQGEAEEVTIEVYMQVWEKAADYDPSRSSTLAWLLMLTRSRAIDRFRSRSKRNVTQEFMEGDFQSDFPDPQEISLVAQQRKIVQEALSKLNPGQRKSIELAYFYGFSQSEIAKHMNQPLGTVKSWIRLGMITLRDNLLLTDEDMDGAS